MTSRTKLVAFFMAGAVPLAAILCPAVAQTGSREGGFTLAFVDADVRRVADAVLGAMMQVDYSVDPAVTGNVTIRTVQPVGKDALLPLLESALASVDAVVVRQGTSYRVVPRKSARGMAFPVAPSSSTTAADQETAPGYTSEIITLRFASAREMARLIEEFVGKEIVVSRNDAINQIVIAGTGEERTAAKQVVIRFDVDSLAQMNYEIYRLESVDAAVLVGELQKIFAPPFDIIGSRVRLIPLPRLRSLLAIATDRSDLGRIEPWIRKLDVGTSGKRKLYNYAVQNGRARDLARSLQLVLGQQPTAVAERDAPLQRSTMPSPRMAALAGSSSGSGSSSGTSAVAEAPAEQAPPSSESLDIAIGSPNTGVRIVPNESNNSLLIYADGEEYAFIKDALAELDRPVAQVLIEATLAEVTLGNDLQYGVDFKTITGDLSVTNVSNTSGNPAGAFPGLSASLISGSTTAILNTLQSKTNVRVLSAPRLFVLNNQPATLQVGDQVPIVVQQSQSVSAPGAPIVSTVELRDTGVILQVTPRVNQSGVVTLDIAQEVSDVARTTTSGINSPTIQQRRLTSTVSTRSGQVVALGGLIRENASKGRSGVPILSQIPIIGAAFGMHTNNNTRTELIILIKPTLIRSPDEVKASVDALIDGLEMARPLVDRARAREVRLPAFESGPALPGP